MSSTGMILRARAAATCRRLRADAGFGVLEVLVSALVVFLVSLGVFAALDAAGRTADTDKSKSTASSLAQSDQERMRSLAVTALSNLDSTRTATVDGESYSVRSVASYVSGPDDATNCTSATDSAPRYLKMTSTVSWQNMRGSAPVQADSLRAMTNGSTSGLGTLAIGVQDRNGAGVQGVTVAISGASTRTGTTNAAGCITFGYITPGNYTINVSKTGYVDPSNPTNTTITDTAKVAADGVATDSYQYDQAGGVAVSYVTNAYNSTTTSAVSNTQLALSNAGLGSLPIKTFTHASATSFSTGLVNFPFPGSYEAYAGACAENDPPTSIPASAAQTVTVMPGVTNSPAVTVRLPRLRFKVQRKVSNGTYAYVGSGTATIKVKPGTTGCTQTVNATWISNTGSATGNATQANNYSTYEAVMPYSTNYTVCAAYNGGGGNVMTGVQNLTYNGSTWTNLLTIPYSTTAYTGC